MKVQQQVLYKFSELMGELRGKKEVLDSNSSVENRFTDEEIVKKNIEIDCLQEQVDLLKWVLNA